MKTDLRHSTKKLVALIIAALMLLGNSVSVLADNDIEPVSEFQVTEEAAENSANIEPEPEVIEQPETQKEQTSEKVSECVVTDEISEDAVPEEIPDPSLSVEQKEPEIISEDTVSESTAYIEADKDVETDVITADEASNEIQAQGTSWDTAMQINVNQTYSDSLASNGVRNYYSMTIDKPGELSLTFDHGYVDSSLTYWKINIYNSDNRNNSLAEWSFKGNETVSVTTDSLGIAAGSYFVQVDHYYYSNETYSFKVNYTEDDYWEKEFNNTFVTATAVPVNENIKGSLQFSSDEDYYLFELADPGRVRVSFDHGVVDSSLNYWKMQLYSYEDPDTSYLDSSFGGNTVVTAYTSYFGLPAGRYVLKIEDYYYSSVNYKFNINYLKSDTWEKENNDSFLRATPVDVNTNISGSLQQGDDEDYYSFRIEEGDNISFSFSHDLVDSGNTYWRLNLYNYNDVNNSLLEQSYAGNDSTTRTSSSPYLKAGTYIIKIHNYYYSGAKYTFRINTSTGNIPVTNVLLAPASLTLAAGGSGQLTATVVPSDATNKAVYYSSSNTSVATVDNKGNVTGMAAGTAVISVTTVDGGKRASCTVTVTNDDTVISGNVVYTAPKEVQQGTVSQNTLTKKGEIVGISVNTLYIDAADYTGTKISPSQTLKAKTTATTFVSDMSGAHSYDNLIKITYVVKNNTNAYVDGVSGYNAKKRPYFYVKLKLVSSAAKAAGLSGTEIKTLKKEITRQNKSLKQNKCYFNINPLRVTTDNIRVRAKTSKKTGKIYLNKKGGLGGLKSVKFLNGGGSWKKASSKHYTISSVNTDSGTVVLNGKGNLTGAVSIYVITN